MSQFSANHDALPDRVDVAVIGGGPAGSTIAALIAREGHTVLVMNKEQHPRFHIGESLLPHNLRIFRRLGVERQVERLGVYKPGIDFTAEDETVALSEILFSDALEVVDGQDHAYQVLRSEFDRMLFEHAGTAGALLAEGARVREVDFDTGGPTLKVDYQDRSHTLQARFVVDASGRDAFLARKLKLMENNRRHGTAALFGHFRNVPRRSGQAAGNISIYWFDQGWIWMIPLPDGIMSIGAVCNPEYLRRRRSDVESFFSATMQRNRRAWARLQSAKRISPITATGNYSYFSRQIQGKHWLMAGDAGMFIDPVFSSGVYFGMHSAELGADVALAELSGDRAGTKRARRRFERRIWRGVRELSWFIYRFPAPAMREAFLRPRNPLRVKQAIISALAGDVHGNWHVIWRLRVFRLIYAFVSLRSLPSAWQARRQRLHNARVKLDRAN